MASIYSSFLRAPDASQLASDASINYITTTTVIHEAAAIIKHLAAQAKQVTKKEEKVLSLTEGPNNLFLETELTLQFNYGGGAYLPSMDENLLDEKLVIFPVLHVVDFDGDRKIKQIRLHWDQGTLLKQVEAIGKTGRNWPIRDGKAQADAIANSVRAGGVASAAAANGSEMPIREHKKHESISATRDPHASLNLFAPRDPNEYAPGDYQGPKTAPRASAKPAPRNYNELFASGDSPAAAAATKPGSKARSPSPSKVDGVILKSGAGKHYTGNRLFDDDDASGPARSPERKKVFSQKYDHFAFGDGEDAPETRWPTSNGNAKGGATFSFEDSATPPKYQRKARPDDQVHWGEDDPPSPPKRPIVHAARKDADQHFSFNDDASPAAAAERPKSSSNSLQQGMKLYHDPVAYDETLEPTKTSARNTTNTNNGRRGDDFGAHYSMADSQPQDENAPPSKRSSTRGDMEQHWAFSDPKVEQKIYKTAGDGMGGRKGGTDWMTGEGDKKIYKTAGDGMGGRKTAKGGRAWGIGDESDIEEEQTRYTGRGRRPQAQAGAGY